jgi:hypothetical protein
MSRDFQMYRIRAPLSTAFSAATGLLPGFPSWIDGEGASQAGPVQSNGMCLLDLPAQFH